MRSDLMYDLGTLCILFWVFILVLVLWGLVRDCADWVVVWWQGRNDNNESSEDK